MRFLFVVLFLKVFQKLSLEFVNVFNVPKNSGQLRNREHPRVLTTLSDVALRRTKANGFICLEILEQYSLLFLCVLWPHAKVFS